MKAEDFSPGDRVIYCGGAGEAEEGVVHSGVDEKTDIRPCEPVEVPEDAIVFRVPVAAGWGLK